MPHTSVIGRSRLPGDLAAIRRTLAHSVTDDAFSFEWLPPAMAEPAARCVKRHTGQILAIRGEPAPGSTQTVGEST